MQIHFASQTHSRCDCRSSKAITTQRETLFNRTSLFSLRFLAALFLFSSASAHPLPFGCHVNLGIWFGSFRCVAFVLTRKSRLAFCHNFRLCFCFVASWKFQFPIICCDNFDMVCCYLLLTVPQSNCIKSTRKIYIHIECKELLLSQCSFEPFQRFDFRRKTGECFAAATICCSSAAAAVACHTQCEYMQNI